MAERFVSRENHGRGDLQAHPQRQHYRATAGPSRGEHRSQSRAIGGSPAGETIGSQLEIRIRHGVREAEHSHREAMALTGHRSVQTFIEYYRGGEVRGSVAARLMEYKKKWALRHTRRIPCRLHVLENKISEQLQARISTDAFRMKLDPFDR